VGHQTISAALDEIRHFVNEPRKLHALLRNEATYYQVCSCLDVIEDTELAFQAYDSQPSGFAADYLLVYGLLQAMFMQQDAVRFLCEALGISTTPIVELDTIREIRNAAVGHPTKRHDGRRFHRISRPTLHKWGFELLTLQPGRTYPTFEAVNLRDLLASQRQVLQTALTDAAEVLRKEEMEHREAFKDRKLTDVFPQVLPYYFEKIYEATRQGPEWQKFGIVHVDLVNKVLDEFRSALEERGLGGALEGVEDTLGQLDYVLPALREYFEDPDNSRLTDRDPYVFWVFAQLQMHDLQRMAGEIDHDYSRQP